MRTYIMLLFAVIVCGQTHAARILVVAVSSKSHYMYVNAAAEELAIRGHEVYTAQPSYFSDPKDLIKLGFKVLKFPILKGYSLNSEEIKAEESAVALGTQSIWSMKLMPLAQMNECESMLEPNFINSLRELHFDFVIVDGFPLVPCAYIVPKLLDVPYACVSALLPWFKMKVPLFPSFVPHPLLPYTENMSFFERLVNFAVSVLMESEVIDFLGTHAKLTMLLKKQLKDADITWNDIVSKSSLVFVNRGPLLEYPAPSMPNTFYLEGLTARPASPLPKEINEMVEKATTGIIVVSFGSIFDKLPIKYVKIFLEAFSQRQELFFFRRIIDGNEGIEVPKNVKFMSWLPQNDLLAHPNAKLFITHCGNNGQYEALYHGIPMIGFPFGGDQNHNAARIVAHGYGLTCDLQSFTSQELLDNINKILGDISFRERTQKAAALLHSKPMSARETAAYWIEHVLEFGSDHLRSHALDMPLYQFYMLDILGFILIVSCLFFVLTYFVIRKLLRICFKHKMATKLKSS